jgi:hypothetical protein
MTPPGTDWSARWTERGFPWRTEPEIPPRRRWQLRVLAEVEPSVGAGRFPFRQVSLNRADVEWLLATQGPGRSRDLRGACLAGVDLSRLPLARMRGGAVRRPRVP